MPSGFSAWGGAWNPADIGSNITLTNPITLVNGVERTWAAHQAAGYDKSSINANPRAGFPDARISSGLTPGLLYGL
jgi:hypothetical protein